MNRALPVDATVLPPLPNDLTLKALPRSSRAAGLYAELIHQLFIRLDIQLLEAFNGERVTLVVHGGAPILTHRGVAAVQQQTRRTTTRDVNFLAGAFAAEWAARGVSDAQSRLHAAAQEVALQIGVGLGWLEADTDAFLPTWTECVLSSSVIKSVPDFSLREARVANSIIPCTTLRFSSRT